MILNNSNNKILGIGIDSVNIHRFRNWQNLSFKKLKKIFSEDEIEYCLSSLTKSAERFAGRFAAKEAMYKALSPDMSFLRFCKYVEIKKDKNNMPKLDVHWDKIGNFKDIESFISITHTDLIASVIVILQ